jgi:hypothetical protein
MAVLARQQLSGVGVSAGIALPMRYQLFEGNGFSLLLNFSGGGPAVAVANVQLSNDPLALTNPTQARWNNHDVLVGITVDRNNSIFFPVYACRLQLTAWTSGTVALDVGTYDYQL